MIFINGEHWSTSDIQSYVGEDETLIQIRDKMKELKSNTSFIKGENPVVVKYRQGIIKFNGKKRIKEGKRGVWIPYTAELATSSGTRLVTYCISTFNRNENVVYSPSGEWFRKTWMIGPDRIELAVFMILFCPQVKNGLLVIEDISAEAEKIAEGRSKSSALYFYLYNTMSPVYSDEAKLKTIAQIWGIGNVGKISDMNQLKNLIFDAVEVGEKKGYMGYADFVSIASKEMSRQHLVRAYVQEAIDKKVISFDYNYYEWKFAIPSGAKSITKVPPSDADKKTDILVSHMMNYASDYDLMILSIGKEEKKGSPVRETKEKKVFYTPDELSGFPRPKLMTIAKSFGVAGFAQKTPAMIEAILGAQDKIQGK